MPTPVLHLLAGPNGAGKTTYYEEVLGPATGLPFINADQIARQTWPDEPERHAYDAARQAAALREDLLAERRSFLTETVFSHPSKVDLLQSAVDAGYQTWLYAILIPEELAVRRVEMRVRHGGHDVPEEKVRQRYGRLWTLVRQVVEVVDEALFLDNSRAVTPFREVARFRDGHLVAADWPPWTPDALR